MSLNPQILKQANIFNGFWERFSEQVGSGKGVSDFPASQHMTPKYVTTIARIPDDIARKVELIGQEIISIHPHHYLYPSTDLHFTFINLDAFFPDGFQEQHEIIFEALEEAVENLPPLEFEAKGVGLFPTTIFVQLYDTHGVIEQYRTVINRIVRETLKLPLIENKVIAEHIAFINLIRFKEVPGRTILDVIKPLRETSFGTFTASQLELVTTDKLLSRQNTITHHGFPLNHAQ